MGIKNHKAKIRMFAIIFIVGFALASLYGGWIFLKNNVFSSSDSNREVAIEVNGTKIYRDEIEKEFQNIKNYSDNMLIQKREQLSQIGVDTENFQTLPDDILKEYIIKTFIDRKVLLSSSKDLKIKVSNVDINKRIAEYQVQSGGKERFIQTLMANGYNLTTFKEYLRNEEIVKKVQEKILESSKVSEEELKKTYERHKYQNFTDLTFEEAKPQIVEILNSENSSMLITSYLNKALDKAKINFKIDEYKKLYENSKTVIVEKAGYKFTKSNLNENLISDFFSSQQGYSQALVDNIKNNLSKNLENLVSIMNKAKAVGIKSSPEFVGLGELSDYSKKYYNYILDTYQPPQNEMTARFNENRDKYNIKNTIKGYVVGEDYQPSEKDIVALKSQADDIMKTITKENFSSKAKELSKDPGSKDNGGSLGEDTDITQYVPEFTQAIQKAKSGDIVGPVKTDFGYHIIYVQRKNENDPNKATVSHILLTPTVSEETKKGLVTRLTKLKEELASGKVKWADVDSQEKYNFGVKEYFRSLKKSESIPGIGNDATLSEKLFSSKIGEIIEHNVDFGVFLLVKNSEIPSKEVTFEEVKERIRLEIAFEKAEKELGDIQ